jgi:hypothetical protein
MKFLNSKPKSIRLSPPSNRLLTSNFFYVNYQALNKYEAGCNNCVPYLEKAMEKKVDFDNVFQFCKQSNFY